MIQAWKDSKAIKPLTEWYWCKPKKTWVTGVRLVNWRNMKDKVTLKVIKYRRNRALKWMPTKYGINLNLSDAIEFIGEDGLISQCMGNFLSKQQKSVITVKKREINK